ncbi:hypothetical protein [Streptomyces sp. NPDC088739]|uniref:hypothetical protein n=1 Tax=Streptomyces sp. NPDC088739 TaxID=3365882 RepID=UPI00380BF58D
MPRIPVPPPPTRDGAPLTPDEIAYLFNVGINTARSWAASSRFGKPVGKHYVGGGTGGRPKQAYAAAPVLNYGLITGRLDPYWNLLDDQGRIADRSAVRTGGRRGIPPEPTTDLEGRRYLFVPHAAARLGVPPGTIDVWQRRPNVKFPPPDTVVEGRPTWFEATLVKWGKTAEPPRLNEAGEPVIEVPENFKRSA